MRNKSVVAKFLLSNFAHGVMSIFVKNERLECEIKVPLGYYYKFYQYHM